MKTAKKIYVLGDSCKCKRDEDCDCDTARVFHSEAELAAHMKRRDVPVKVKIFQYVETAELQAETKVRWTGNGKALV